MWDFTSMFRRSNQQMLQESMGKSMLLSFNDGEIKLHENMFKHRSIISVNMSEIEREIPEPGQPAIEYPSIYVSHNQTEDKSYVFLDKTDFDALDQPEIDELIYQFYSQMEPNIGGQYHIDVPDGDEIKQVLVQSESRGYTVEEQKEVEEKQQEEGAADSEEEAEETQKSMEEAKQESEEESKSKSEDEKEKNPRYAEAKATWGQNSTKSSAKMFKKTKKPIGEKHLKEIHKAEEILRHAIHGEDGGKSKSISPAKRLNMRAIITESSDNEYITHHGEEGKDIKINLIVDRSGSMHGRPSTESNILIAALNNLAFEYEELDVEVMLSETSNYFNFKLPVDNVDSETLWEYRNTGGSEGLSRTFNANFDRMKNANVNLVYTDGDIYDEAIDKAYMQSQEIELVGMYVNADFTEDQVMKYYEKNQKYFTHTIIRKDMVALVNELANRIYLSKDGK